jgi:hypothetical protein
VSDSQVKPQGLSLLDIAPQFEDVPVGDSLLRVYGVTAQDVVTLLQRFPETQAWFSGSGFNRETFAKVGPGMIAAIIAAACHECGNPKAEERAGYFSVEQQMDVLEAVGRLTFRNGFGPFVARLAGLARLAVSENYGKAQDTNSPPASTPSSEPATPPPSSGT